MTALTDDRQPRPCRTCGRIGSCADCCCAAPDHHRPWPLRPDRCSLCSHVTGELPVEAVAAQAGVNRALSNLWQVRHVESGATVCCRNRLEAEAHVREAVSGPWVAERVVTPCYTSDDATLEMSRRVEQAERRAEDVEAVIEATRDLLDGWEQDGPDDVAARADYDQLVAAMRGHSTMPDSVAPMCTCGHRWWRHQDSSLSPECLDCDCTQFEELTPAGWLARWTVRGAENDAWGERPEDVLLCTHQEESGHCSLPYGHDGGHVIPSAE